MNVPGGSDLIVQACSALLDALDAGREHREAVILIGAQAIYVHTGRADIALAEATKDSDLALDTRHLANDPRIDQAMTAAGFIQDVTTGLPGAWINPTRVPLTWWSPKPSQAQPAASAEAPASLRTPRRRHGALSAWRLRSSTTRRGPSPLWARATTDSAPLRWLDRLLSWSRSSTSWASDARVRGALRNKDAHDIYRIFVAVAVATGSLAATMVRLLADPLAGAVTE